MENATYAILNSQDSKGSVESCKKEADFTLFYPGVPKVFDLFILQGSNPTQRNWAKQVTGIPTLRSQKKITQSSVPSSFLQCWKRSLWAVQYGSHTELLGA